VRAAAVFNFFVFFGNLSRFFSLTATSALHKR
jgi:hypothetical protein